MFGDLKRTWEAQSFTKHIVEDFLSMLDDSRNMLRYALKVIRTHSKGKKSVEKIYIRDKKINITEQEIRKRILVHIVTNPAGNLPASLALIGLSRDAESIGDLVKNVFELNTLVDDEKSMKAHFDMLFEEIGEELLDLFDMVMTAFQNSDTELALEVSASARSIAKRCEDIVVAVVASQYTAAQAVVLTLGSRFMKRIALHLANVAASIFLPLPETDYIEKLET